MTNLDIPTHETEHFEDAMESLRQHSPAVADDLVPFVKTLELIENYEREHLATEMPEDYRSKTNINFDVMGYLFVGYKVLQNIGGEVVLVGTEGDRDNKLRNPDNIAVYGKNPTADVTMQMVFDDSASPAFRLLVDMNSYFIPDVRRLDANCQFSWVNDEKMAPLTETDLIERAFMTSVLRGAANKIRNPKGSERKLIDGYEEASLALFQKFADKGLRSLGFEETYGMMTASMTDFMDRNPQYDVRTPKPAVDDLDFCI